MRPVRSGARVGRRWPDKIETPKQVGDRIGMRRQRSNDFSDRRALTRIIGMPRADASIIMFGQSSIPRTMRDPAAMIEKTAYEAGNIERNELMNRSARKALFGEPTRSDGARCYQHAHGVRTNAID
jgi:hypothetical protein